MKMSDEKQISADRETVWNALTSPDVLKECVPGAQDVTGSPEEGFEATVTQKVGPVKACLLYTSPSPRDRSLSRMPSSA